MIAVLRISGQVDLSSDIKETLDRLKIRKKLTCTFIDEKDAVKMGMMKKVTHYICYGEVDDKLMKEIIAKRGQKDVKGVYRGFCRMHPPIGGFKKSTRFAYPRGILESNKEIAKLLVRML